MAQKDFIVVEEYDIRNFDLFSIANSSGKMLYKDGKRYALRFLLKNSFKAKGSNRVVNNFVLQIIEVGKDSVFQPDMIVDRVKVQKETVIKEKLVKEKPEVPLVKFNVGNNKEVGF